MAAWRYKPDQMAFVPLPGWMVDSGAVFVHQKPPVSLLMWKVKVKSDGEEALTLHQTEEVRASVPGTVDIDADTGESRDNI